MEGFTHLIPHAAGHEVIRQGRRDLTPRADDARRRLRPADRRRLRDELVFSWGGNPGVGSLHRFRDAVEHGWPHPLAIEEHSHAGMAARYVAGASGLPFGVLRGYVGTDLVRPHADDRPDHVPVHRRDAHRGAGARPRRRRHPRPAGRPRRATCSSGGWSACRRRRCSRPRRSIVTVEEIVDELEPRPNAVVLPAWVVDAVCDVPGGAHPSFAMGYCVRDNDVLPGVGRRSRATATRSPTWIDKHVHGHRRLRRVLPQQRGHHPRSDSCLSSWSADDLMIVNAARAAERRRGVLRRHRAAVDGREPRPAHARDRVHADLRVGLHRLEADAAAAVDRRRRARRHGRRRRVGARDLRLLAAGRARSTSASSARRSSTASATSTPRSSATTTTRRPACPAPAARPRSPHPRAR